MITSSNSRIGFHLPFHFKARDFVISEHASLYLTDTIRVTAISLVGIFLPVYIYQLSSEYPIFTGSEVTNGISWVFSYFFLRSLFVLITILLFGRLLFSKLHFQASMLISYGILILEIVLWQLSQKNLYLIWVAGCLAGVKVVFYWIPYHIFFLHKSGGHDGHFGKQISLRLFLTRIFSALAPAVGGLIIFNYGFNVLFLISIILLIISALPIITVIHEWQHKDHRIRHVIKAYIMNKKMVHNTAAFFGEGMESIIYAILWPLLLFFVLNNFAKLGYLSTASLLLSSIAVLFLGRFVDEHGAKKSSSCRYYI